jgi:DNA polymerase I-like protein with 3'-5' exonuclease and polymerase domains
MTVKEMYNLDRAWKRAWPEVPNHYLRRSADMVDSSPTGTFTSYTITGRPKANCIYTEGSNYPFQGLAADGAKAALWAIWRECILGWYWNNHAGSGYGHALKDSPLRDSRLVNFVHDEIVAEHLEGDAGKAALKRQEALMISEMTRICQNKIKISVEGQISDAWEH